MDSNPENIGPITKNMLHKEEGKPPDIIEEWGAALESPGDLVFLWAGVTRTRNGHIGWLHIADHVGPEAPDPSTVLGTAPEKVERLLSPLAHEGRIRIMQALYGDALTASELAAHSGLRGGGLYHHLKELKYANYVRDIDGKYTLTAAGRQLLVTVTLIAEQSVVDRGEDGLAVGFYREDTEAGGSMSDLQSLPHSLSADLCDPARKDALQIIIEDVLGTADKVEAGGAYVVRGVYRSTDPSIAKLTLSAHGRSQGKPAVIAEGSGRFEVTARPLEVEEGKDHILDLLMFDKSGEELGVRLRLELKGPDPA